MYDDLNLHPIEARAIGKVVEKLYPEDLPFKPMIIGLAASKPLKAFHLLLNLAQGSIVLECSLLVYYELRAMNYSHAKMTAIRLYRYFSPEPVGLLEGKRIIEAGIYNEENYSKM